MYYIGRNHDDEYFNGMKTVILSAISVDGIRWNPEEGVRVAPEDWVDVMPPRPDLGQRKRSWIASPEAVVTPGGGTKLYFWGICHGVCLSRSGDGLTFKQVEQVFSNDQLPTVGNAGDPAILRLRDGTTLLFYNSLQNGYRTIYIARRKATAAQPSSGGRPTPIPSLRQVPPLTPTLIEYVVEQEKKQAILCRPEGEGPFPVVVYNHGSIVDEVGYLRAAELGYNLDGICHNLAQEDFLAFLPLRRSGAVDIPQHRKEVLQSLDYVLTQPEADASRVALMGFSRGALLTLMVGVERVDLDALVILAPAPGRGHFAQAVERVVSLNAPVLLLVEASDSPEILQDFQALKQALHSHGKEVRAIRYTRGGGHRLFWDVSYGWEDPKAFLPEKLGGGGGPGTIG
jgi:dienelactone hydrolase